MTVCIAALYDHGRGVVLASDRMVTAHIPIGHGAIGSGAPHALYSLIEAGYRSAMPKDEVIELVTKAKTRSEVAPGVGRDTTVDTIPSEDQHANHE